LTVGILSVVVVVALLTMMLNARNGVVDGKSASLAAESIPVGTDYSGTVTEQLVQVGDQVRAGQPLFELDSASLQRDITQGLVDPKKLATAVRDGSLVLAATDAGRVDSVAYAVGSFVAANSVIATVQRAGSLHVEAEFLLTAQDYGRLAPGATMDVVLPSNQQITARVGRVQVQTVDGVARTSVLAYSPDLAAATFDGLFAVGTPVSTTLHLRNDGVVTDVTTFLLGLVGR
jgi:multidrug efflux pump subunit AcrA (membrane-fusion protein)